MFNVGDRVAVIRLHRVGKERRAGQMTSVSVDSPRKI